MNKESNMNKEEIKNEFINCIEGTHTLNLAISVLEDREDLKKELEEKREDYNVLSVAFIEVRKKRDMYKDRINKAIEYEEESYNETVEGIEGIAKFFSKRNETLLKILKGEDKE